MEQSPLPETLERLVQHIAPRSRLIRAWPLTGGISAGMTALEIEKPGGARSRLIVRRPGEANLRQNPRAAEDEYHLLRGLHARGLAVPDALYLAAPGEVFSTACLVIEYVEGQMDFAPAAVEEYARQLAVELARIHQVRCAPPECPVLSAGDGSFARQIAQRPARLNDALEEVRIRAALETVWPIPQRNAPALLHGDYWPGNVLWRGGQLAAVIDWEDAALGEPLIDLAIARLDLLWIIGRPAMDSFTHHYLAQSAVDASLLPCWDLCAALRLARLAGADLEGWAAFFHPYGRRDITAATIREHYRFFIAQAFGLLPSG